MLRDKNLAFLQKPPFFAREFLFLPAWLFYIPRSKRSAASRDVKKPEGKKKKVEGENKNNAVQTTVFSSSGLKLIKLSQLLSTVSALLLSSSLELISSLHFAAICFYEILNFYVCARFRLAWWNRNITARPSVMKKPGSGKIVISPRRFSVYSRVVFVSPRVQIFTTRRSRVVKHKIARVVKQKHKRVNKQKTKWWIVLFPSE